MMGSCHGADLFRTPTIKEKTCPNCGGIIEIFSTDVAVACDNCGFIAYNDTQSCVKWCAKAKECVGEELYNRLMEADRLSKEAAQK